MKKENIRIKFKMRKYYISIIVFLLHLQRVLNN